MSTALSQVAAIDAASGQTLWVHDPQVWMLGTPANFGWVHRGVAYWTDGRDERIFIGTGTRISSPSMLEPGRRSRASARTDGSI